MVESWYLLTHGVPNNHPRPPLGGQGVSRRVCLKVCLQWVPSSLLKWLRIKRPCSVTFGNRLALHSKLRSCSPLWTWVGASSAVGTWTIATKVKKGLPPIWPWAEPDQGTPWALGSMLGTCISFLVFGKEMSWKLFFPNWNFEFPNLRLPWPTGPRSDKGLPPPQRGGGPGDRCFHDSLCIPPRDRVF